MSEPVKKSAFADSLPFGRSAISNWIMRGKLTHGRGLVMVSGAEMIDPDAALAELHEKLDPSKCLRLPPLPEAASLVPPIPPPHQPDSPAPPDAFRDAKTEQAQISAEMARLKLQRELGEWVSKDEAAAAMRAEMAQMVATVDRMITSEIPKRVAAMMELDPGAVKSAIKAAWRAEREAEEQRLRRVAESRLMASTAAE